MNYRARALACFLFTLLAMGISHAEGTEPVRPFYGVGFGRGISSVRGDYIKDFTGQVFSMGFNVETEHFLGMVESGSTTANDALKYMDFVLAFGWEYFKMGTGFMGIGVSLPTDERLASGSRMVSIDYSRETTLSVTVAPIFARLYLWKSRNLGVFLDGYYGLASKGSMTLPTKVLGAFDAYISSEPQEQGGGYGGRFSILWRWPGSRHLAVELSLRDRYAKMNPVTGPYLYDIFGMLGTATTPDIEMRNRTATIQLTFVM